MRRILLALLALTAFAALPLAATAQERITAYDSVVQVQPDGSLEVTETISVHAEGRQVRRGIYRDFPTRYRDRLGNRMHVGFEVVGVERDGRPEAWFTEKRANGVRVNTGDDSFLRVPADYTWTLRYRTTRQLGFFKDHDELYWNAIGTGWIFPIERGSAEIHLPGAVPDAQLQLDAWTGAQGTRGDAASGAIIAPGVARWELTAPLAPREGLTVLLGFPQGMIAAPSRTQKLRWLLADNRALLAQLFGLALLLLYCLRRWLAVGRDPPPGVIIPRYEPPAGWSPAALRMLQRYGQDQQGFVANLLELAVRGHLRIEREGEGKKATWRLVRTQQKPAAGDPARAFLHELFPDGERAFELKSGAYEAARMRRAMAFEHKRIIKRLEPELFKRHLGSALRAWLIAGVTAVLGWVLHGGLSWTLAGLDLVMLVVIAVFSRLVRAPTPAGRKLLDEVAGFKDYLGVAERDDLGRLRGPGEEPQLDAERWQRLLPYAVALGVEKTWTQKFTLAVGAAAATAAAAGVTWYRGGGSATDFTRFSSDLTSGLSRSIASAATPPGSSSGGGGGGSSGGGGGGGGGGGR